MFEGFHSNLNHVGFLLFCYLVSFALDVYRYLWKVMINKTYLAWTLFQLVGYGGKSSKKKLVMSLLWHEPKVIEKQTVAKPHQKWIEINYRGENISKWHIWAVKKSSLLHFKTGLRSKFKPTNEWM